jgi:hypothetical protein
MQRKTLGGEHPGPAALGTEGVRAYPHNDGALRRSRRKRQAEGDDVRASRSPARTGHDNLLGVRVEDFNAVELAGNSARALAANVSTLVDEELLTRVEARPGSGIVVRREMANDPPQEGAGRNRERARARARSLRGLVRKCRAHSGHGECVRGRRRRSLSRRSACRSQPERDRRGRLCRSDKRRIFGSCPPHP